MHTNIMYFTSNETEKSLFTIQRRNLIIITVQSFIKFYILMHFSVLTDGEIISKGRECIFDDLFISTTSTYTHYAFKFILNY